MTAETELTNNGLHFRIAIEKWLVREYGSYSVGQLKNGHLIVVTDCGEDEETYSFQVYEYVDFHALHNADGIDIGYEVPFSVLRAVAHALGITHVEDAGKIREVNDWFRSGEDDPLKDVEYQSQ